MQSSPASSKNPAQVSLRRKNSGGGLPIRDTIPPSAVHHQERRPFSHETVASLPKDPKSRLMLVQTFTARYWEVLDTVSELTGYDVNLLVGF
jgi:hypothetical protein